MYYAGSIVFFPHVACGRSIVRTQRLKCGNGWENVANEHIGQDAAAELRGTALQPCLQVLANKEEENRQAKQMFIGNLPSKRHKKLRTF